MNIMDDTLLSDSLRAGQATPEVLERIVAYAQAAQAAGADMVMCTCTTVNRAMELARPRLRIPAVNIDEPMLREAVRHGECFGIVATLKTSPLGTRYLLERCAAQLGRQVRTLVSVNPEAFDCLMRGDTARHDELVRHDIDRMAAQADVVLLGQISLSQVEHACGKPLFQIGKPAVAEVERLLYPV